MMMHRFLLCCVLVTALWANPENPVVVSGEVSVSASAGILEVTASNRAVVEWERFSIGASETVRFVQPSSVATVLNRVTGTDMSTLSGVLQSNGVVYLINPRGVIVGAGAVIDTAGFLATTLDVENGEFLGGGDVLFTGDSEATVVQQGTIRARDGNIVLIAHSVRHEGKLVADNGSVALVAGHEVLLKPEGMPLLTIRPDLRALGVENLGSIEALNAYVLSDGVSPLMGLRQDGEISLVQEGGKLVLSSTASGATIGQKAVLTAPSGTISVSAEEDIVFNLGNLNASGGTINVTAPVFINTGTLRADGSGGTISVEAENTFVETTFGHLSAGTISVSAPSIFSSGKHEAPGGQVRLTGDQVTLIAADILGQEIFLGAQEVYTSPTTKLSRNVHIVAEEISHDFGAGATNFPTIALVDPLAASGGTASFGNSVAVLSGGNIVVTKPQDSTIATNQGAVYLYNGTTGALISTLVGTSANDAIGSTGISALIGNSNYLIRSPAWTNTNTAAASAGAVTWASGTSGISGSINATNSLVGTSANDAVGIPTALSNGNYVVGSPGWMGGNPNGIGAATWGNGMTGIVGTVSGVNSLLGSVATDRVSSNGVSALLTNGNYVVNSPGWMGGSTMGLGAATWGNGATGTTGTVSTANSLIGSMATDLVSNAIPTPLNNGNYVVRSPNWMGGATNGRGAATWGNGSFGVTGTISLANSLIGSAPADKVSSTNVSALSNNHYVVASQQWTGIGGSSFGAATWGNGTTGITGTVSIANSLIGNPGDLVSNGGITSLTNGNYVVRSSSFNLQAPALHVGAATWGNGSMGTTGTVSMANSLTGSTMNDQVAISAIALTNGNYVVESSQWTNPAPTTTKVGAATWGNGMTGITGTISIANSLLGSTANDQVGINITSLLTNGNYVVQSGMWMSSTGAATWGDGSMGTTGTVSIANSLTGSIATDGVSGAVAALTNGNYVVRSPGWHMGLTSVGAATWSNGSTGITGTVSTANSLIGSTAGDQVSGFTVISQTTGDFIVASQNWNPGALIKAGAATWGNGSTGITGTVSAQNSVIGTTATSMLQAPIDNPAVAGLFIPQTFVVRFTATPAVLIAGLSAPPTPPTPTPTPSPSPSAAVTSAARIQYRRALAESFEDWNDDLFGPYLSDDPWAPIYTAKGLLVNLPSLVLIEPWQPHTLLRER